MVTCNARDASASNRTRDFKCGFEAARGGRLLTTPLPCGAARALGRAGTRRRQRPHRPVADWAAACHEGRVASADASLRALKAEPGSVATSARFGRRIRPQPKAETNGSEGSELGSGTEFFAKESSRRIRSISEQADISTPANSCRDICNIEYSSLVKALGGSGLSGERPVKVSLLASSIIGKKVEPQFALTPI